MRRAVMWLFTLIASGSAALWIASCTAQLHYDASIPPPYIPASIALDNDSFEPEARPSSQSQRWLYFLAADATLTMSYAACDAPPFVALNSTASMLTHQAIRRIYDRRWYMQRLHDQVAGRPIDPAYDQPFLDRIGAQRRTSAIELSRLLDAGCAWHAASSPHTQIVLRLPLWATTAVPLAAGPGVMLAGWVRGRRRRKRGLCPACGYNLTGLVSDRCPECGGAVCGEKRPSSC